MRRFFVKNLLFVIAVNLLVKPLWVLMIDRTVQNRVGHADYGIYQALVNLGLIFNIVLDFGLSYFNTKVISGAPGRLRTMFPAVLSARMILMVVYGAVVMIAAYTIGYTGREIMLLTGILLIQSLNSLMLFLRSSVSALHKFKLDALLSVVDKLLMIVLCSGLLFIPRYATDFKIEWFVVAQIICYIIAVIIAMWVMRKMASVSFRFSSNTSEVTKIIRDSLPFATLIFLTTVHMRADTILVERLSGADGKELAGIYASGYRLLDVGNMFGIMFAGMLLPMFSRIISKGNEVQPIVRLATNILLPSSIMIAIAALFFGNEIMHLLYTDVSEYSGEVFAWLMACFPAYCIMYIYSTLLTANSNLMLLNKIALVGVVINLSLNIWLIPEYQVLGAARVAFATQITMALLYIFFSSKKLRLPTSIKWIGAHVMYIILLLATGYLCQLISISWEYQIAIYSVCAAIYVFLFRFISVQSIKTLLHKDA